MGTWKVKEINEIAKSDDEGDAFRKEKLEFLALTETKLKKNMEVSWCRVNGIIVGVQEIKLGKVWRL